jgi:tetratricopeptide (TPR) repeat protein
LLLADLEESPNNDRQTYYTARELFFYNRFEEATKLFKRHLTMPESVWPPERAWSMRYLAKMHPDEAEHWHLRACAEYPTGAEVWTDLAKFYYSKSDWIGMYYAAKRALDCQLYKGLYLTEPDAYGWWPNDLAALSAFNLGLHQEAIRHGRVAVQFNPTDERLKNNLFFYKNALSGASVIIPTKSNFDGLKNIINQLMSDKKVRQIIVVADGTETYNQLTFLPPSVMKLGVMRGSGISAMWNLGVDNVQLGNHVFFVNDDVSLKENCVSDLVAALDADESIGLVCPHYAQAPIQPDIDVTTTCQGNYDGTGGMAGFAMMLSGDLAPYFKFNEEMKWWWSDNQLVDWTNKIAQRRCVITSRTSCVHAHSQTIDNDPPVRFAEIIVKDKEVYERTTAHYDKALKLSAELYFNSLPAMTHRCAMDIHEHLNTLRNLANECSHVTEFGTRYGISTAALICGQPQKMVSYDINADWFAPFKSEAEALAQAAGVNFQFVEGDVLGVDIEETDLLFIDTHHTYNQLTKELNKHSFKVRKYIVLHDTVTYGTEDEKPYDNGVVSEQLNGLQRSREGLQMALEDFLEGNPDWKIKVHYPNNNGLTVLKKLK